MFKQIILITQVCAFITHGTSTSSTTSQVTQDECASSHFSSLVQEELQFSSNVLPNEFIVRFKHFYGEVTRTKFLNAAFKRGNSSQWRIVKRLNAASAYPSDFDVVRFVDGLAEPQVISDLLRHPQLLSVTEHRSVQRRLYFNNLNETSGSGGFGETLGTGRRLLRTAPHRIASLLQADKLWKRGVTGKGVKVAVFDTGLAKNHPHFRRVKERTNWTNEKSLSDGVSHGTFVAGIIASSKECLGLAPDAELHIYRVFTNTQVSYTSWFLDAFNYAIFKKIQILNLSIGGPDFLDRPFVDKVLELTSNRVVMVSAIGNDGPLYGTLNNPGDQSDVIGVGGINYDEKVAKFSSRGMTTWELPLGYGRLKPDIVTFGSQVVGSDVRGGCRSLSGTSVASPVVAGALSLLISGALDKLDVINPSSMKQVLIEGSTRLPENNMYEQGHGKLDLLRSMKLLSTYSPKVTLSPAYLDFTEKYMWPYSSQPLYCSGIPTIANITILNGISVSGKIVEPPVWHLYDVSHSEILEVSTDYSSILWPWSGWMSVFLAVNQKGCTFKGEIRGFLSLTVQNPSYLNSTDVINSTIHFPINAKIIPKPPRNKRILWDQYHNLRYPPGYIPRDSLKTKSDPLDWRADHIHTNFRDMYTHLRNMGYYMETLGSPFTCFNASEYGTLLIIDPEEEFFDEEIVKIQSDVYNHSLSLIVFADWYNTTVMKKIQFFDENTRQWWIPDTGGANLPALNDLLKPFGVMFGDYVGEGKFKLGDNKMYFNSGSTIARFPNNPDDIVIGTDLKDQGAEIISQETSPKSITNFVPILGLFQTNSMLRTKYMNDSLAVFPTRYDENPLNQWGNDVEVAQERNPFVNKRALLKVIAEDKKEKNTPLGKSLIYHKTKRLSTTRLEGRIAVFGDSNCLDSTHIEKACFWLLDALLEFTMNLHRPRQLHEFNRAGEFKSMQSKIPLRLGSSNLHKYSRVLDANNKFKKRSLERCASLSFMKAEIENPIEIDQLNKLYKGDTSIYRTGLNDV